MINLSTLNPQQRQAVETTEGPVMILAGAGTGKTRVITFRIAHLIAKGVKPENILAMTFTNKAAREMKERVGKMLPKRRREEGEEKKEGITISTFHSLCARLLRQYIERLGYKKNFVIFSDSEQLSTIKKVLSHVSNKSEKIDPYEVMSFLGKLKNGALKDKFGNDDMAVLAEVVRVRYESALRACNAVDFDDLLGLTVKLLREHEDVLHACRKKYKYVMVDEYQDTNSIQFELVRQLTSGHQNLCVVGDDDQSIYGWRGAEISNLLDMEKWFPKVKVVKLEQNYRSTNTILNAANAVIKNNPRRRAKQLWSAKGQGSKILLYEYENEDEEARNIVEQIEYGRMTRKIAWSQYAILFRTNMQARALESALRAGRIRYHLIGGQSYFDRREVKDFLAYLKLFINPHDDVSLLRVANVPARGLSDLTMERLLAASQQKSSSVYAAIKSFEVQATFQARIQESILDFMHFIDKTRAKLHPASGQTVFLKLWAEQWLEEIGYWEDLRRSEKTPEAAESRIRNLKDLTASLDLNNQPTANPIERLATFLENLTLDAEQEEEEENVGDAVTLITMHSCKGLEYPHVFIVGAEDGILPHMRSKAEGTLDEERRLFYVAITRAQETLAISFCLGRKKYGATVPCHPSPFLNELPEELVERDSERAKKLVTKESGKSLFASLREAIG